MGKLIELNEALKIGLQFINQYETFRVAEFTRKLNSLPQIDIVGEIEKMIEELIPTSSFGTGLINSSKIDALQELLQKFKS